MMTGILMNKLACIFLSGLCLVACNKNAAPTDNAVSTDATTQQQTNAVDADVFVGCYSVEKDVPAQIKISHDGAVFAMQMKENSPTIWDTPEALNTVSVAEGWRYFSTNAINLNQSEVTAIIARADEVMAMAKVVDAAVNINPQLDSAYVVNIAGAVNTIYQVPCDEVPMELKGAGVHSGQ